MEIGNVFFSRFFMQGVHNVGMRIARENQNALGYQR
jgi:hypothetical protein